MKLYDVETYERCIKALYEEAQYYIYFTKRLDDIINDDHYDNFDNIVNIIHNIIFWYHSVQQWLELMLKNNINFYRYTILYSAGVLEI
jgi:hypothetical protein